MRSALDFGFSASTVPKKKLLLQALKSSLKS
jgi:hypothetical protein